MAAGRGLGWGGHRSTNHLPGGLTHTTATPTSYHDREILLNCVDMDGQCKGYDLALVRAVRGAVTIPVIASSGAGAPQHFSEVRAVCVVPWMEGGFLWARE